MRLPGILHRTFEKNEILDDRGAEPGKHLETTVEEKFDFFRLSNHCHEYEGFLNIPADGAYTFHFRPVSRGALSLGGETVIPEQAESR